MLDVYPSVKIHASFTEQNVGGVKKITQIAIFTHNNATIGN